MYFYAKKKKINKCEVTNKMKYIRFEMDNAHNINLISESHYSYLQKHMWQM